MQGIRPAHVTVTLVSAFAASCLALTGYAFLHVPSPAAVRTAASFSHVVPADHINSVISGMDLASMKSTVMGYDFQHQRQVDTVTASPAVTQPPAPPPAVVTPPPPPTAPDPNTAPAGDYSYAGLEQIWEANGGSSQTASVAACIAEHESGGNPGAISPTDDFGLWQIHADPAALAPNVSAAVAVQMSGNGTNWGPWTTAGDCGV
jgi:Lysozyme like domain